MTGQALVAADSNEIDGVAGDSTIEFVTFNIAGQLFGIPVLIVQDILLPESIASIPLAPPEVRGSINLRGRIVTVIDVRVRLGLNRRAINAKDELRVKAANKKDSDFAEERGEARAEKKSEKSEKPASGAGSENVELSAVEEVKNKKQNHMMAVTVEHHNELYTLLVDSVGDVIPLSKENYEGNPSTLDPLWREFAGGVYRLEGRLMVVLDVERLLDFRAKI